MAKVTPMILLDGLSGKVCGHSNTYFAQRNGTIYTGTICNPYKGEPTEKQLAVRQNFTAAMENIKNLTPEQMTEYETAYKKQKKYRTLRGYIFAQLYNQTNN